MRYRDGNHGGVKSLLSGHFIHYCLMTAAESVAPTHKQPIGDEQEIRAHSLSLSSCSKSQRRPACAGGFVGGDVAMCECLCTCVFGCASTQMFLSDLGIGRDELRKGREPSAHPRGALNLSCASL